MNDPLIFERSSPGHKGYSLPEEKNQLPAIRDLLPDDVLRKKPLDLPEVSELDVVRHFTRLSQLNFSIDTHFYPLGSCTMKYNPKVNEKIAALSGFANVHPYQPERTTQGLLQLLAELEMMLCQITGMDAFTLQPAAGAHGELTGLLLIRAYHAHRRQQRTKVLVPDSAHGTNPSSAHLAGFDVVAIPSNQAGEVDLEELKARLDENVAAIMLTNPNTHGVFETRILEIAAAAHRVGALLYYDGANMNALLGLARPGDMGFDVVHLNLHKSFSTPHGGGGPGAGPVGVKKSLEPFLPTPQVHKSDSSDCPYRWDYDRPLSIGKVRTFYGNMGMLIRAYAYIRAHGADGLRKISKTAIVNANYIRKKLAKYYHEPFGQPCMHECVLSAIVQKKQGSSARDIAKRLLDHDFHAPTIYFPLTVPEALMIEPTETESRHTLDRFVEAMIRIAEEISSNPSVSLQAPFNLPVKRVDEVKSARELDVNYPSQ